MVQQQSACRPLTNEQSDRLARVWKSLLPIAGRFSQRYPDLGVDWTGVIAEGIIRRISNHWDPSMFEPYARRWATLACIDALRQYRPMGGRYTIRDCRQSVKVDFHALQFVDPSAERDRRAAETREQFDDVLSILKPSARRVMRLRYCDGYSREEIVKITGIAPNRVGTIIRDSLMRLWVAHRVEAAL